MLRKNDDIELNITAFSGNGSGIGRVNNMVVFVSGAAEGDRVLAHVIKVTKSYAVAKLINVISPSPFRTEPDCPAFPACGGCAWRHISYEKELEIKRGLIKDAFLRLNHIDIDTPPVLPGPSECGYRNKAQFPVAINAKNEYIYGFYANGTHRVTDGSSCKLQDKSMDGIADFIVNYFKERNIEPYNEVSKKGCVRHLYFRANRDGKVAVIIVIAAEKLYNSPTEYDFSDKMREKFPQVISLSLNINKEEGNVILGKTYRTLYETEPFYEELFGMKLLVSPSAFFQVNRDCAEQLFSYAFSLLKSKSYENVYDLYCGAGAIGLSLLKYGKVKINRLIGVEIEPSAVENAKINARNAGFGNTAEYYAMDSAGVPSLDIIKKRKPSLVILDPPRKGCDKSLLEFLSDIHVPEILYISCDPTTLARDVSFLFEKGYTANHVRGVDMFPRTRHVESVILLSKTC